MNTMSTISLRENVNKLGGVEESFQKLKFRIGLRRMGYGPWVTNWRSAFSAPDHWEFFS